MIGTCNSCHDGTIATGKSVTHINSSSTCDDCHNSTVGWVPVAQMDHWVGGWITSVIGTCNSCHDGAIATGKSATHISIHQARVMIVTTVQPAWVTGSTDGSRIGDWHL